MSTALLVITLISVATAIICLAVVRRLARAERERSEARVAALAQAADSHAAPAGGSASLAGEWQRPPAPERDYLREPVASVQAPHIAGGERTMVSLPARRLFGTVERDEPAGNRLPLFAAAALIVILGGALVFLNTSGSNGGSAAVAQANPAEPLELVALGHAREVRALTISGTVRNPASGVKVEGLTAVISLLDRTGALVSTKDVPLDYRALGPGEEAPFKVSIPDPGSIARYRVSFRTGADVVPHIDRRANTKLASALQ